MTSQLMTSNLEQASAIPSSNESYIGRLVRDFGFLPPALANTMAGPDASVSPTASRANIPTTEQIEAACLPLMTNFKRMNEEVNQAAAKNLPVDAQRSRGALVDFATAYVLMMGVELDKHSETIKNLQDRIICLRQERQVMHEQIRDLKKAYQAAQQEIKEKEQFRQRTERENAALRQSQERFVLAAIEVVHFSAPQASDESTGAT